MHQRFGLSQSIKLILGVGRERNENIRVLAFTAFLLSLVFEQPLGTREEPVWVRFHIFFIAARSKERLIRVETMMRRQLSWEYSEEQRKDETQKDVRRP